MPSSVSLETYGKAVVVKGDTRELKDFLKAKGGRWFPKESGWMFPGSKKSMILSELQGHAQVANVVDRTGSGDNKAASSAADVKQPENSKKRQAESTDVVNDGSFIDLGASKRCSIAFTNGRKGVDLRQWYKSGTELNPGKGIRFGEDEWAELCEVADKIDAGTKSNTETRIEVGSQEEKREPCIVSVSGDRVDLRKWYTDKADGEKKPTKKGINLSLEQWAMLRQSFGKVDAMLKEAKEETVERPAKAAKVSRVEPVVEKETKKKKKDKEEEQEDESLALSKASLKAKITAILEGKDLNTMTPKVLRRELEKEMQLPEGGLDEHKDKINSITKKIMEAG